MSEEKKALQSQARICPHCCDDHAEGIECNPFIDELFVPHESDNSFIAKEYRERVAEIANLKKQNEALNLEKSEAWECIEMHYKEQIENLKKQKEILLEALEFYGNLNTYYINGRTDMRNHIQDRDLEHVLYHYRNYENLEWIGGRKAREALKKVEGME